MTIRQTDKDIPRVLRYFRRNEPHKVIAFTESGVVQAARVEAHTAERFDVAIPITAALCVRVRVIAGLASDGHPDVLVSGHAYLSGPTEAPQARMELEYQADGLRSIRAAAEENEAHLARLDGEWTKAVEQGDREASSRIMATQATTRASAKAYRRALKWMGVK